MKNAFTAISRALIKRKMYSQTVRELRALTNRDLNDLGITRDDIDLIARQHAQTI